MVQRRGMKKGFTLVELLVVVAVVGILATVVVLSSLNAKKKARDTQRKNDVAVIVKAVQTYRLERNSYHITYNDDTNGGVGSKTGYVTGGALGSSGWLNVTSATNSAYAPHSIAEGLVSWNLILEKPADPTTGNDYMLYVDGRDTTFSVYAHLEIPSNLDGYGYDGTSNAGTDINASCSGDCGMNYRQGNGF